MRTTGDKDHILAGMRELRAKVSAGAASAEDRYAHPKNSCISRPKPSISVSTPAIRSNGHSAAAAIAACSSWCDLLLSKPAQGTILAADSPGSWRT
jgi:hypothetical protein